MVVNSTTVVADIYKEFYTLIRDNISSGTEVTYMEQEFPAEFPIVMVGMPTVPRNKDTFSKYDRSGELEIDIASEQFEELLKLYDEVENIIHANRDNLSVQNIQAGSGSPAPVEKGGKYVYIVTLPFSFMFKR